MSETRYTAEQIRLFIKYGESWIDNKSAGQIKDEILAQAARDAEPTQPVEAVDERVSFEAWASQEHGAWLEKDTHGCYNIHAEESMWLGWQAALAHPRPTGDAWSVKVPADRMAEAILSMQGSDGEVLDGTLWLGPLDDGTYGVHLSCDECPEEGSITLAALPAPTIEQAGEVVNDSYETGWADGYKQAETDGKLIALAQPRPVGVPDWKHIANEWSDIATNAFQWLKNIQRGISTADEAMENMQQCIAYGMSLSAAPAPAKAGGA